MTVKDLAEFTSRDTRTIRRWISKTPHDKVSPAPHDEVSQGIAHEYNLDEVEEILKAGSMSKDSICILMQNARKGDSHPPGVDYEVIGKMIGMAITAALAPVVQEMRAVRVSPLQIEAPVQDYYSLTAYCSIKKIPSKVSELRKIGWDLKRIAEERSLELHAVPDERWGKVNGYPVEILDEYFSL